MIKRITQIQIQIQIQAKPEYKDIEASIESFFTKYMGWKAQLYDIAVL